MRGLCGAVIVGVLLFVAPALAGGAASPSQSHYPVWLSNILPGLFPPDAGKPQPQETLKAPFAEKPYEKAAMGDLPTMATPIDQPHRSNADLTSFVQMVVSDTFSFKSGEDAAHLVRMKKYYSDYGIQDVQSFLTSTNIASAMQAQPLQMSTFADQPPQLRSQSAVDGVYKWLFDVPVRLTLQPPGAGSYQEIKNNMTVREVTLRLQITRVATGGTDGMAVERLILAPAE